MILASPSTGTYSSTSPINEDGRDNEMAKPWRVLKSGDYIYGVLLRSYSYLPKT